MRQEHDNYPTPQPVADAISSRLASLFPTPSFVVEPSAGCGNFVRAAANSWPGLPIYAVDVREECRAECAVAGAAGFWQADWPTFLQGFDFPENVLFLGNPPFSRASEHIIATVGKLTSGSHLAFLLKANFISGERRARKLWGTTPFFRYFIPIAGRPSFVKGEKATNDFNEYAVYVWEGGYRGRPEILPHIFWK